jgi:hypothetical protein
MPGSRMRTNPGADKQHPDRLLDPVKPYSAF